MKAIRTYPLIVLAAAILSACGGGGSSSTSISAAPADTVKADIRDPYIGTWIAGCNTSSSVRTGSAFVKQTVTTTLSKAAGSSTAMAATQVTKFYAPTDSACAGAVLTTETRSNATWEIHSDVTKLIPFGATSVTATAMNLSAPAIGGLSAGTTVTIGDLVYPGNYFTTPMSNDLWGYSPETGKLYITALNNAKGFDLTTYPVMTKQ